MSRRVHVLLDDRGIQRALVDLWMPALDADVVWFVGPMSDAPGDEQARDVVPVVPLSAMDVAAITAEPSEDDSVVLVLFCTTSDLQEAAMMGMPAGDVTLVALSGSDATTRLSAEVHVRTGDVAALAFVEQRGFTFALQPLPNVTERPWSPAAFVASQNEPESS